MGILQEIKEKMNVRIFISVLVGIACGVFISSMCIFDVLLKSGCGIKSIEVLISSGALTLMYFFSIWFLAGLVFYGTTFTPKFITLLYRSIINKERGEYKKPKNIFPKIVKFCKFTLIFVGIFLLFLGLSYSLAYFVWQIYCF